MLLNRIDLGMTLPQAIAAPRAIQRNTADGAGRAGVPPTAHLTFEALGHSFVARPGEIGAATGIEFLTGTAARRRRAKAPRRGRAMVETPAP